MAEHIVKRYGPWKGVNEQPVECSPGELEDAWNVDFDGGVISTRGGREVIASSESWKRRPLRVYWNDSGTNVDGTASATSDLSQFVVGGLAETTDYLVIAFQSPEASVSLTVGAVNSAAAVLSCQYFGSGGWKSAPGFTDGTATAGVTLAKSGTLSWTIASMSDWRATAINGGSNGFVIRLRITGGPLSAGSSIGDVYTALSGAGLKAINGLYQWSRPTGERMLVVGMDNTETGVAQLSVYDRVTKKLKPFSIDGGAAGKSGAGAWWQFAALNGMLVACNGYTLLHSSPDDPYKLVQFESVALIEDAIDTNVPPTSAAYIAVHNGSLYAVSRDDPNKVRISAPVGDNNDIALDSPAPFGGANIWYKNSWFKAEDPAGGPITGMVSFEGKLLVFTPRATHVWTGDFNGESGGYAIVDSSVGCVAPRSLATTPGAAFFLGDGGVYAHSGGVNRLVSKRIGKTISGLNKRSLTTACGVVYRKRGQYRLHVPAGANPQNDVCLAYDYNNDAWSKYGVPTWLAEGSAWSKYRVKLAASIGDESWGEELIEADYSGQLLRGDTGNRDGTKAILSVAVFDRYFFEDQSNSTIRHVRCEMLTRGGGESITCSVLRDGETWQASGDGTTYVVGEKSQTLSQLDDPSISENMQVYATGTAGSIGVGTGSYWRSRKFVSRRASFGLKARSFQVVLHTGLTNGGANTMTVRGVETEFIPESRR